jgi:hypothetical protein
MKALLIKEEVCVCLATTITTIRITTEVKNMLYYES